MAVVVEAPLPIVGIVLAGVEQLVAHELHVVQQRLPAGALDLVVPVHHHALSAGVHGVVVDVLLHINGVAFQLALQLRVLLLQQILVHQVDHKQVPALLNVRDPRLPEQFQQVDLLNGHIAQAVFLAGIPEHAVGRRAVLQLLPPVVGVGLLIVVVLQNHRQDRGEGLGAVLVAALPGQHHRLRVVVHRVGVLIENAVEQPCGGGFRRPGAVRQGITLGVRLGGTHAALAAPDRLPVPQLPPQLIVHNAGLQVCLALFVLGQQLRRPLDVLLADGLLGAVPVQQHGRHLRRHIGVTLYAGHTGRGLLPVGRAGLHRLLSK